MKSKQKSIPAARNNAEETIRRVLLDVLPPDAIPSFRRIVRARFSGRGRVVAELEMVDGLTAEVEAWQWCHDGWAHRWLKFEGGDLLWEDGRWWRIATEGQHTQGEGG